MPKTPELPDHEVAVEPPAYVRVRAIDTKHEYSLIESAVDPEAHEVIDKPALDHNGEPIEPHYPALPKPTTAPQKDKD